MVYVGLRWYCSMYTHGTTMEQPCTTIVFLVLEWYALYYHSITMVLWWYCCMLACYTHGSALHYHSIQGTGVIFMLP